MSFLNPTSNEIEELLVEYVSKWLYLFTSYIETESEEEHCKEAFKETGGAIPKKFWKDALEQNQFEYLRLRCVGIIWFARGSLATFRDNKFKKRHKGMGLVVPRRDWADLPEAMQKVSVLEECRDKGYKKFMENVNTLLEDVHNTMVKFPFSTFMWAFPGVDENKIGWAWNSLMLFFAAGLLPGRYFPYATEQVRRFYTFQDAVQECFDELQEKAEVESQEPQTRRQPKGTAKRTMPMMALQRMVRAMTKVL